MKKIYTPDLAKANLRHTVQRMPYTCMYVYIYIYTHTHTCTYDISIWVAKRLFCLHSSTWVDQCCVKSIWRPKWDCGRIALKLLFSKVKMLESCKHPLSCKGSFLSQNLDLWSLRSPQSLWSSISSSRLPPWRVCCRCASTGTSQMQGCSGMLFTSRCRSADAWFVWETVSHPEADRNSSKSEFYRRGISWVAHSRISQDSEWEAGKEEREDAAQESDGMWWWVFRWCDGNSKTTFLRSVPVLDLVPRGPQRENLSV